MTTAQSKPGHRKRKPAPGVCTKCGRAIGPGTRGTLCFLCQPPPEWDWGSGVWP